MKKGFTLAEVLIVIGIIGVVAEMTIPTLCKNVQDQVLKTQFKETFSQISQMANILRNDNGGTLTNVFKDEDVDGALTIVSPYFSKIKSCNNSDKTCMPQTLYDYSGNKLGTGYSGALVLKNGTQIRIPGVAWVNSNCTDQLDNTCMGFMVDVNGIKNPNKYGEDIFFIRMKASKTVPTGVLGDSYSTDCGTNSVGIGCAGWVMTGKDY